MRRTGSLVLGLVLVGGLTGAHRAASAEDAEARLIAVLQSDQGPAAKDRACFDLRQWGTVRAVPALAALLPDEQLTQSVRCALEAMPCPEAGTALREALPKTAGKTRAGIIDSLGTRRDRGSVPALSALVADPDALAAASAAASLGKIGGPDAVRALREIRPKASAELKAVAADALLRAADLALAEGDAEGARSICQEMAAPAEREHVRTAATRGLLRAAGDGAAPLVEAALTGKDRAAQRAAIPWVREMKGEAATKAFAGLVARVPPGIQVALLESLEQRGDPAAAPAVAAAAGSPVQEVRIAALAALGTLGNAAIAPLLAEAAAKATGVEQSAARRSLDLLRDAKVCEALLAQLPKAQPPVQGEIVRALGQRQETQAVPALLKMAAEGEAPIRMVALRSLAVLADGSAVGDLIRLLLATKEDAEREAVEKALGAACERSDRPTACAARVLEAMKGAAVPARAALLRVAGRSGGADALRALREGLQDGEAVIRDAALRTMAESAGLDAAPDLLALAREATTTTQRVLALRGCWRMVALAADRPVEERWTMCKAALAAAQRPEEKKLGLTELAKLPHPAALQLAETLCGEETVRDEAEAASVRIAAALAGSHPAEAKAALRRIATTSKNEALRAEAGKALDAADQYAGYVTAWLAAGPYRQDGKQCQELFDIPFPPEQPGGKVVAWKPAPRPADPALFWQADLASVVGGDHAVAYLKSRVRAPREMKVRLEIGTDDGVKVWVNGKLVHANNAVRGLKPGEDKAEAVLKEGANDFLLKITQHTLGCGACVRIRSLDGSVAEGLQVETGDAETSR
jgi:HEAT repeat protein